VRALVINCIFLALSVIAGLYFLHRTPQMSILFAVFTVYMLYQLLKTCSIRISLDWPELHYSYRSLFRHVDIRIPSWEITGVSPEITSMWRGNISEKLVMQRGEDEFLLTPYYSGSDMGTASLMALISELPSTRQEALERVREARETQLQEGSEGRGRDRELWVMLQVSLRCTECGGDVPVTGPFEDVSCGSCGNVMELEPDIWKGLLSGVVEAGQAMQEGEGGSHRTKGPPEGLVVFGRMKPYCRRCKADLEVSGEPEDAQVLKCPECGCTAKIISPPDWFGELVPGTFMILGPDSDKDESFEASVDAERWFAGIKTGSGEG
jgi:hypothetical protein